HEEGIHVAVDTSGIYCEGTSLEAALEADLILLDIKSFDPDKAKALTGFSTDHAYRLLRARQEAGKPVWIRHVMVPGITLIDKDPDGDPFASEEEWRSANKELIDGMRRMNNYSCIERVDLLPFHKMGEFKYEELHFPYELKDTEEPSEEVVEWAEKVLKEIRS
ncbi:MAG: hypothetical protein IKX04_01810, partial [Clostridiales bacterium]|nr:hypothetical protein [Clostridiales bacterium]